MECWWVVYDVCFFKQKTAYEMRISDWSSDVCSSDLQDRALADPIEEVLRGRPPPACDIDIHDRRQPVVERTLLGAVARLRFERHRHDVGEPGRLAVVVERPERLEPVDLGLVLQPTRIEPVMGFGEIAPRARSEEHTSELQSLMRISYAVFC